MMRFILLAAFLVGCGEESTGGETRVPEDYLPEGASLDGLTEAQRICTLHRQVSYARARECDPEGPEDWSGAPSDEEVFAASMNTCKRPDQTMAVYTPPSQAEHVLRCLDFRASAPCTALARAVPDPTYADCELVSPSW